MIERTAGVSRADVWAMVVVGGVVGVLAVIGVVVSAVRAVRGEPLEVTIGSATDAPIGDLGALLGDAALGRGAIGNVSVLVDGVPTWVYVVEVGVAVIVALLMLAIAACLVLLTRRLGRGQAFGRVNTWLVGSILMAVTLWWAAGLAGSAVRFIGAFESSAIGDWRAADLTPVMDVPLAPVLVAIGLVPLVAAFRFGERLQRDSEGLV
jgi:hypothetical protein